MEKISIIVPGYNAEKFARECIESVINQTYTNLEIILVDDGSKDSTGEIFEEYAKRDRRVIVIHQENKGISEARNAGLDKATGEYIMFIDADDLYEENTCELLYNEIKRTDADYVIGNYIHITYEGEKWDDPVFDQASFDDFKIETTDYKKSFFVMNSTINAMLKLSGKILADGTYAKGVLNGQIASVCGIDSLQMGVFAGVIVGLVTAALHNRFYKQKLPAALCPLIPELLIFS